MSLMDRIIERTNQILDLPERAEEKAFDRLAQIERPEFVRAVKEKVSIGRGAARFHRIPPFRIGNEN